MLVPYTGCITNLALKILSLVKKKKKKYSTNNTNNTSKSVIKS